MSENDVLELGILTVSDRAYNGEYDDISGPAIEAWMQKGLTTPFNAHRRIVPDEQDQIQEALIAFEGEGCHMVLTTGGTGPAKRDVTPEATLTVGHKVLPGFGEKMRAISLQYVPTAILSRQVAVIRNDCLIVNLPGSPRSIAEILDELMASIPYCIELMGGPYVDTDPQIVEAFRPKKKK